jgi:hypothetical protein
VLRKEYVVCLDSLILCPPQHGPCKLCTLIFMKNNKHSQQYMSWLERTNNFLFQRSKCKCHPWSWMGRQRGQISIKFIIQHVFSCLKFGQVKFSINVRKTYLYKVVGCTCVLLCLSLSISVSAILLEGISTCFFISVNKERQKPHMSVQKRLYCTIYQEASRL